MKKMKKMMRSYEEDDEELSLLVRNVKRLYRKNKLNFRRKLEGKEERRIICFN